MAIGYLLQALEPGLRGQGPGSRCRIVMAGGLDEFVQLGWVTQPIDARRVCVILLAESVAVPLAGAHLLGSDIATTIGKARLAELLTRCPGERDLLVRELEGRGGPALPQESQRRRNWDALTRELAPAPS